jgi:hypothetical protein
MQRLSNYFLLRSERAWRKVVEALTNEGNVRALKTEQGLWKEK